MTRAPATRPIVLLTANPGDRRDYDGVAPGLAERGRVIPFAWPVPDPPSSASAMFYAEALARFARAEDLHDALIIGNSVGGYAALRLALEEPTRVAGLILVAPGGFTRHNVATRAFTWMKGRAWFTRLIGPRFTRWYLKKRTPVVAGMIARADQARHDPVRVAVDAAVWRSFLAPEHDLRGRVGAVTVPTLLVWGRHDPVLRANRDGAEARLCLPHAHWAELDTGHCVFAEDPEGFLGVALPFMNDLCP